MKTIECPKCENVLTPAFDPWTIEEGEFALREQGYGCDTGCMVVALEVACRCGFADWAYEFGELDEGTEAERDGYIVSLLDELKQMG